MGRNDNRLAQHLAYNCSSKKVFTDGLCELRLNIHKKLYAKIHNTDT